MTMQHYPRVLFDANHLLVVLLLKEVCYDVVEEVLPAAPFGAERSPDVDLDNKLCEMLPPVHVQSSPNAPPDLIYGDEHAGHVVLAGHDAGQLPLEVDHVADLPGVVGTVVDSLVQEGDDAREVLEEGRRALRVGVTVELLRGESDPS